MSVIVLRYSLYNLKNVEPARDGPSCMASGRIFSGCSPTFAKMRLTQGA
jgi:hypothetical protein